MVEILVVVVILGLLAGIAVFALSNLPASVATNGCATESQTIRTAIAAFRSANPGKDVGSTGSFATPTQDKIMADLTQRTVNGQAPPNSTGAGTGYIASIPKNVAAGGFWNEDGTGTSSAMWSITPETTSGVAPTVVATTGADGCIA